MDTIVQMFRALGDETRLKILIMVARRRFCAKGIAKHLSISEAAVSQHLKILKEAGIITGEKLGYYVHYDVKEEALNELTNFIEGIHKGLFSCNCGFQDSLPNNCQSTCKGYKGKCHKNFKY